MISLLVYPTDGLRIESGLWFLPAMFIATILYAGLDKIVANGWIKSAIVIVLGCIGFFSEKHLGKDIPFAFDCALVGILFIHTGRVINEKLILPGMLKIDDCKKYYIKLSVLFILSIILITVNSEINMRETVWGIVPISYVGALTSSLFWLLVAMKISRRHSLNVMVKWLCNISKTSIVYLCFNHIAIRISSYLEYRMIEMLGLDYSRSFIDGFMTFVGSMVIMFALSQPFTQTKLRWVIGKKFA